MPNGMHGNVFRLSIFCWGPECLIMHDTVSSLGLAFITQMLTGSTLSCDRFFRFVFIYLLLHAFISTANHACLLTLHVLLTTTSHLITYHQSRGDHEYHTTTITAARVRLGIYHPATPGNPTSPPLPHLHVRSRPILRPCRPFYIQNRIPNL